jgi:4-hydroxy-4-methyl-2-oxoglutarate aldolase
VKERIALRKSLPEETNMTNGTSRTLLGSVMMLLTLCLLLSAETSTIAQPAAEAVDELRQGRTFMATRVYTAEEDEKLLALYDGLRVADVSDGMDQAGLENRGLVSADIGPLWRDTEHFAHRIVGIAVTVRYVPTNRPRKGPQPAEQFDHWVGQWYTDRSPEPFVPLLRKGSVLVIEDAANADVGSIGSNNIMSWIARGCVGVVTSATARDTDEIITQKVPLYFKQVGRGIRPGRNEIESVNRAVVVGGVLVMPGDVVVADGDGVIVVPRAHAEQVAKYARRTLETDKAARRSKYRELGLPEDDSVR